MVNLASGAVCGRLCRSQWTTTRNRAVAIQHASLSLAKRHISTAGSLTLPEYKVHPTWTSCSTVANYIASLALWTDAGKAKLFTYKDPNNPFLLSTPNWVIRAHKYGC
jgi:hypothetical protein